MDAYFFSLCYTLICISWQVALSLSQVTGPFRAEVTTYVSFYIVPCVYNKDELIHSFIPLTNPASILPLSVRVTARNEVIPFLVWFRAEWTDTHTSHNYVLRVFGMYSDGPNGNIVNSAWRKGQVHGKDFLRPNRLLFSLFYFSLYRRSVYDILRQIKWIFRDECFAVTCHCRILKS